VAQIQKDKAGIGRIHGLRLRKRENLKTKKQNHTELQLCTKIFCITNIFLQKQNPNIRPEFVEKDEILHRTSNFAS
jgi:hypothetical protein